MTWSRPGEPAHRHCGWRSLLLWAATCLLAACGGADGNAPSPASPTSTTLTVTAYGGVANAVEPQQLTVKGVNGIFRVALLAPQGTYAAKLEQLTGPYAVGFEVYVGTETSPRVLGSLATGPGALNVTPLTTLAMAQLTGQDPSLYFPALSGTGDPALKAVTAEKLSAAQTEVKRYLAQQYGITLTNSLGDFFTAPFSPKAGDPMFDAITALNQRFAQRATHAFAVAQQLARHASFCNAERLTLTLGGASLDFCPVQKTTLPNGTDSGLVNHRFIDDGGDVLTVAARDGKPVGARLLRSSGATYACEGVTCAGLALGAAEADGSRPVSWAHVTLVGSADHIAIDGTLQASKPGIALPPLPCDTNRYFIVYPDDRIDATCAASDSAIGAGIGDTVSAGATRRVHTFQSDGSVEPVPAKLEVRADPAGVVSVLVQDLDPDTGAVRTLFKCQGTGCNGAHVGPARDDVDSFPPYTLRRRLIQLDDTVLAAFNPDGTASTFGAATVRAELDSFEIIFPPEGQARAAACASAAQRLTAQPSDESTPSEICPPASLPDDAGIGPEDFRTTTRTADGQFQFLIASYYSSDYSSGTPPYEGLGGVTITMAADVVEEVIYKAYIGGTYRCLASACNGITVSAPSASGERAISLAGTVLQEIEAGGLPGDRIATVGGHFTAPAPP